MFGAGRLAYRLAWRDGGAFAVCAVFVSSCSWALAVVSGFPFSSFGVSSVLLVSAGREVRFLSCECRSGADAVAMWRRLVFSSRVGVPCRLVCFSSLPSLYSDSFRRACRVAACLASGRWSVAVWWCVVAGCGRCDVRGAVAGRCGVSRIVPLAVR